MFVGYDGFGPSTPNVSDWYSTTELIAYMVEEVGNAPTPLDFQSNAST